MNTKKEKYLRILKNRFLIDTVYRMIFPLKNALAMTYFLITSRRQYRQRWDVLLPCSEWKRVVPPRSDNQGNIV